MAIFRVNKTGNYTVMSNRHFKEKEMSLKAKGLLSLMFSLPDDWDYSINGLVAICKENESAVKSALTELKQFGYLKVTKEMPNNNNGGRITYIYDVFEIPIQEQQKQGVENLWVENQQVEKQGQLNTNKSNIKNKINNIFTTTFRAKFDWTRFSEQNLNEIYPIGYEHELGLTVAEAQILDECIPRKQLDKYYISVQKYDVKDIFETILSWAIQDENYIGKTKII